MMMTNERAACLHQFGAHLGVLLPVQGPAGMSPAITPLHRGDKELGPVLRVHVLWQPRTWNFCWDVQLAARRVGGRPMGGVPLLHPLHNLGQG
jgi:hypothetical protein